MRAAISSNIPISRPSKQQYSQSTSHHYHQQHTIMKICALVAPFVLAMSQIHGAYGTTTKFNATVRAPQSTQPPQTILKHPQFDTLPAIPEEGRLSPVGVYLNISYTNFDVSQPAVEVSGLTPQSKPNFVFGVGSASSPMGMTISYSGSKVKSFALSSFYYGCQTDLGQAAAEVPVACNVTATGYKAGSSKPVAVQTFPFTPAKGLIAPLAFGKFEAAFQGLENVTYAQSPATLTELILDTIVGTITT